MAQPAGAGVAAPAAQGGNPEDLIVLQTTRGQSEVTLAKVTFADLPGDPADFCNSSKQQLININDACKDNPELKTQAFKIFTELGLFGDGLSEAIEVDSTYSFSGDQNKKIVNEMFNIEGNSYLPQTRLQSWHEAKQPGTGVKIGLAAFRDQVKKAYYDAGTSTQRCVTGIGGPPVDVVYTFGTYIDPSGVQQLANCRPECDGSVWQGEKETLVLTPAFMNCFGFPGVQINATHVRGDYEDPPVWNYTISVSPIQLGSGPTVNATIRYPPSVDGSDPNMADNGCFKGNATNQRFAKGLIDGGIKKASPKDKQKLIQSILGKCLGDFTQVAAGFAQTLIDKLYGLTAMLTGDYCVFLRCLQLQQKALLTGSASSIAAFDADMKAAKVAFDEAPVSSVNQKLRTLYNYSPSADPVIRARLELEAAKASAIVENRIQIQAVYEMYTFRTRSSVLDDAKKVIPPGFFEAIHTDIQAIQDELVGFPTETVENNEKELTKARNTLLENFKIIPILSADPGGFDMTLVGGARYTFGDPARGGIDGSAKTHLAAYMLSVLNSIYTIRGPSGATAQYDYARNQRISPDNKQKINESLLNANIVDLGRLAAKMSEYANGSRRRRRTMFPTKYTVPLELRGGAKLQTGGGVPEETAVLASIRDTIKVMSTDKIGEMSVNINHFYNYRTGIDNNIVNHNLALQYGYVPRYKFPQITPPEEKVYCQTQAADAELLGMIPPGEGAIDLPEDTLVVEDLNTDFLTSLGVATTGNTSSKYMFYYAITERGQIAGVQTIDANLDYLVKFNRQNGIYQPLELVELFGSIDAEVTEQLKQEERGKQREERSGTGPQDIVEREALRQAALKAARAEEEAEAVEAATERIVEGSGQPTGDPVVNWTMVEQTPAYLLPKTKQRRLEYVPPSPPESQEDYGAAARAEEIRAEQMREGLNLDAIIGGLVSTFGGGKRRTMKNKSKSKRNAKNQTHRKRKGKAVGKRTATAHRPKTARNAKKITKKRASNTKTKRSAKPVRKSAQKHAKKQEKKRAINRRDRNARKDRK